MLLHRRCLIKNTQSPTTEMSEWNGRSDMYAGWKTSLLFQMVYYQGSTLLSLNHELNVYIFAIIVYITYNFMKYTDLKNSFREDLTLLWLRTVSSYME